jgi:hypothetical protein
MGKCLKLPVMSDLKRLHFLMEKDVRTIRRWFAKGFIPRAYRTKGGQWRVRGGVRYSDRETILLAVKGFSRRGKSAFAKMVSGLGIGTEGASRLWDKTRFILASHNLIPDDIETLPETDDRYPVVWEPIATNSPAVQAAIRAVDDDERGSRLILAARELVANEQRVTGATLARQIGISRAGLYQKFPLDQIRRACALDARQSV